MTPFTYRAVANEADAIAAVAACGRYIAGGTTLVDLMREEIERPSRLIDINRLPLHDIRDTPDGLAIGALVRMAEVAAHPIVARTQPLLAETLVEGASPQLRNMASIGGNLLQRVRCPYFRTLDAACNKRQPGSGCAAIGGFNHTQAILGTSGHCVATHPSDLAVSLVALGASLRVRGPQGERRFPVAELYRLPGDTPHLEHTLLPGELIVEVLVPHGAYARQARYLKVRDRSSYEFALVAVAAALEIRDGIVREARLAAGGVATMPWRLGACEAALVGQQAGRSAWQQVAPLAVAGAVPLSENGFKVELLQRTLVRALELAGEAA
ncbi:MAG: xanthine dehydrogenase family protein subunit M [Acetobacteraceae bacterium]